MPNAASTLVKLVKRLFSVGAKSSRGVLMYNSRQLAVASVKEIEITIRGIRFAYRDLTEADQKAFDEVVKYMCRFVDSYVTHHKDYESNRDEYHSLEHYLESHVNEITNAAVSAAKAHARSAAFDMRFGKPRFSDEVFAKEFVNAFADEYHLQLGYFYRL